MAGPALVHTLRYASPSRLITNGATNARRTLELVGSQPDVEPARHFFRGTLAAPKRAAEALLTVGRVARTRFFVPASMLEKVLAAADPVVTVQADRLRFEAFSACAGVYARFDVHEGGFDVERAGHGTTNVDFNPELRTLLARVGRHDALDLDVGPGEVALRTTTAEVIERKVPLPLRWLRSFGEVQAILARMEPKLRVPGVLAPSFLRSLPKQSPRGSSWIVRSGAGLRLSQVATQEGVKIGGLGRLAVLAEAASDALELVGWSEPSGSCAWELVYPDGRFVLALSPEAWRGFSGEGGLLEDLARGTEGAGLATVRAALAWQPRLDPASLAEKLELDPQQVATALATLAARGLVGFELGTSHWFHRELPFQLDAVEALHPRLVAARELVTAGVVRDVVSTLDETRATVDAYVVRLGLGSYQCSCPWYGKHGMERGPCKHVLAVQLVAEAEAR